MNYQKRKIYMSLPSSPGSSWRCRSRSPAGSRTGRPGCSGSRTTGSLQNEISKCVRSPCKFFYFEFFRQNVGGEYFVMSATWNWLLAWPARLGGRLQLRVLVRGGHLAHVFVLPLRVAVAHGVVVVVGEVPVPAEDQVNVRTLGQTIKGEGAIQLGIYVILEHHNYLMQPHYSI